MQLSTYFSPAQKRVLKTLWLLGCIAIIWRISSQMLLDHLIKDNDATSPFPHASPFKQQLNIFLISIHIALLFAWDSFINKKWMEGLMVMGAYILIGQGMLGILYATGYAWLRLIYLDRATCFLVTFILQVAAIAYITKKKNVWKFSFIAGIIIFVLWVQGSQSLQATSSGFIPMHHERGWGIPDLLSAISWFILSYLFYGWYYLIDNWFNADGFKQTIRSKIQNITSKEYGYLFPLASTSCWYAIVGLAATIGQISSIVSMLRYQEYQSAAPPVSILYFVVISLATIGIFYLSAILTRNIVISRMMTIASTNSWLYFIHYIPLLNLIAWAITGMANEAHTTRRENGVLYLTRERSSIAYVIMILGIILSIIGIFTSYNDAALNYSQFKGIVTILILFYILKATNYMLLFKGKIAVYSLVILNVITSFIGMLAAYSEKDALFAFVMIAWYSFFFIVEVCYPELRGHDIDDLPAEYQGV